MITTMLPGSCFGAVAAVVVGAGGSTGVMTGVGARGTFASTGAAFTTAVGGGTGGGGDGGGSPASHAMTSTGTNTPTTKARMP